MNKRCRAYCTISVLTFFFLSSCFSGLAPATSENDSATISVSFSDPGVPRSSRVILNGPRVLYIQTGIDESGATLFCPYDISTSSEVLITDIPAGSYPFMALIVTDTPFVGETPILIDSGNNPGEEFLTELLAQPYITDISKVSYILLPSVTLSPGEVNRISATLLPATRDTLLASYDSPDTFSASTGSETAFRKFVRLRDVGANIPSGNSLRNFQVSLTNTGGGPARFHTMALYDSAGALIAATTLEEQTVPAGGMITPIHWHIRVYRICSYTWSIPVRISNLHPPPRLNIFL